MILVSYDIGDTKLRTKFSHYLLKYGKRLQFSVYEIENSNRVLDNVLAEIKNTFLPKFGESDSVMIFKMSDACKIIKMGYCSHEDDDLIIV